MKMGLPDPLCAVPPPCCRADRPPMKVARFNKIA